MPKRFAIGFDLGGTHLRAGLVAVDGRLEHFLLARSRVGEGPDATIEEAARLARELCARPLAGVIGAGFGSPGMIDPVSGGLVGRTPHLPGWEDYPLRERLAARLGIPVAVDNDANLAALGEARCGAAQRARVSVTVTVGTGVGCGIVIDGQLLRGAGGGAGEVGHLPLGRGGLPCRCGVVNCVEPEMSGNGLARHATDLGLAARDAAALFAASEAGVPEARELVARLGDRLGAAIAAAVNLLNPEVVVIGGGLSRAGEVLLRRVREGLDRYALASHRRNLEVVPAQLGERAAVVGAGLMMWGVVSDRG